MFKKAVATAALVLVPILACAQAWPVKTVRIVVPWAPGGQTDAVARLLATKFGERFKQAFVVENRPGGGGMIGSDAVARAPADGYTLLFTSASISVNSTLMAAQYKLDPAHDLTPIVWAASEPLVLTVPAASKARTVAELVEISKASKSGLNGAYNGGGTTSQIALEMLKQQAGANIMSIPYKGGGPSTIALIAGEIDLCFATLATVKPQIESGKLRGLAVSTAKPSSALPALPTMTATYPGFESDNWFGLLGPRGLPADIVEKLNSTAVEALRSGEVYDIITKAGGEVIASTPEQFSRHLVDESARYAQVIKAGNMKPE
jgi:tripartite-type tricarboxylate transporter receptor subunit TctC